MHKIALDGYGRAASTYHLARPRYPREAVDRLVDCLGLDAGSHVVELGAGTGIFTRQLIDAGPRVSA